MTEISYPQPRECLYQPSSPYQNLGKEGPMHRVRLWNGDHVWLVTGHQHARRLLSDPGVSADRERPDFPVVLPRFEADIFKPLALIGVDAPKHTAHRKLLAPEFGVRQVRSLQPTVTRLANELIDKMLHKGPPADLVADYALPIPSTVISELLGVPYADHDFFETASMNLLQAKDAEGAEAAGRALWDYLDGLITAEQRQPTGSGVLAKLVAAMDDDYFARDELLRIALTLLLGGHDTTASMIALGTLTLLENPDQLAAFKADPAVVPDAVEELLRMISVTDLSGVRVADRDIEIDGQVIRAGEGIVVCSSMANRDPDVYDDPYTFDIGRDGRSEDAPVRRHLTFGYGVHQCLGQNLARMELETAYRVLFERIPGLRLAVPTEQLPVRRGSTMQGVHELPVAW